MKVRHRITYKKHKALLIAPVVLLCVLVLYFQLDWLKKNYFSRLPVRVMVRMHCDHCHRTGEMRDREAESGFSMCPVCQGVGYNCVRRLSDREALCPACAGMGRIEDMQTGLYRTCLRCDGRGLIQMEEPEKTASAP